MSFWRRLLGFREATSSRGASSEAVLNNAASMRPSLASTSEREGGANANAMRMLGAIGEAHGPGVDEAVAALRVLVGGPHEGAALRLVVAAAASGRAPEPLRVVAAEAALLRGETSRAAELLEGASTIAALLVRAEALASTGDTAGACATLERALARDIDAHGARERLTRLRVQLGVSAPMPAEGTRDAPTLTLAPPEIAAPFRVRAEVGRGGAAAVYEAYDVVLDRHVALKIFYRAREQHAQIEREARVAVAVTGLGVARIFDADLVAGWIAPEWAARGALRDALASGEAWPAETLAMWLPVLVAALARVHRIGWVHGDVKPANVLFRSSMAPLLADFGLARRPGEPWAGGTIGYLSPERLGGDVAAFDDDVYALGRIIEDVTRMRGRAHTEGAIDEIVRVCLAPRGARPSDACALLEHPALRDALSEGTLLVS